MKVEKIVFSILLFGIAFSVNAQEMQPEMVRFSHVNRDKEAIKQLYNQTYLPARNTNEGWRDLGNCSPGTPSPAAIKARLAEINYFRKMAGLHAVTFDPTFNHKAQAAAYLMRQNSALSHNPPTTWKCYTKEGAAGAGSCNLGYGGGIYGYISDFGGSNQDCGHRMWILKGRTQSMGYGGTDYTDAIYVFGPTTDYDSLPQYVAWPPAGFVPTEIVSDRWTFALPGEYADFKTATAELSVNGAKIPLSYSKPTAYGDGGMSFEIADWNGWSPKMQDQKVKVRIQKVKVGNEFRSYSYEVVPFRASSASEITYNNDSEGATFAESNEEDAEPTAELPFEDQKPMALNDLAQATELSLLTINKLKSAVVRDLMMDVAMSNFARRVAMLRKEKNPDPAKMTAWAEARIKQYLGHLAGLDEEQIAAAEAPKILILEFKKIIPLGTETYAEIAKEFAAKFAEKPELKAFALKYKRVRQCGFGLAAKAFVRDGQTYAGVYATLVLAPAGLRASS